MKSDKTFILSIEKDILAGRTQDRKSPSPEQAVANLVAESLYQNGNPQEGYRSEPNLTERFVG